MGIVREAKKKREKNTKRHKK